MFTLNNLKVWLIKTVLVEKPYGHSPAQMVCVEIYKRTSGMTYGKSHMDTYSHHILSFVTMIHHCFVAYNNETFVVI